MDSGKQCHLHTEVLGIGLIITVQWFFMSSAYGDVQESSEQRENANIKCIQANIISCFHFLVRLSCFLRESWYSNSLAERGMI